MGQMLQTHARQTLRQASAHEADNYGGADDLPLTSVHHLRMARGDSTNSVPLFDVLGGAPETIHRVAGDARSALALRGWLVQSLLLEAIMRDEVGEVPAAEQALERALAIAEHDRVVLPFTVDPVPSLLERHARRRSTHAGLIAEIFGVLGRDRHHPPTPETKTLLQPLTDGESRVLRYLPTNLSKREIAEELYVSVHTIKTHMKHIYAKLDAHDRREAVRRAREGGLLGHAHRTIR